MKTKIAAAFTLLILSSAFGQTVNYLNLSFTVTNGGPDQWNAISNSFTVPTNQIATFVGLYNWNGTVTFTTPATGTNVNTWQPLGWQYSSMIIAGPATVEMQTQVYGTNFNALATVRFDRAHVLIKHQ